MIKSKIKLKGAQVAGMLMTVGLGLGSRVLTQWSGWAKFFYLGDALWAMLVYQILFFIYPSCMQKKLALGALAISFLVEFSQRIHEPHLDAFRKRGMGHLLLGNGFDPWDLVAYILGIALLYFLMGNRERLAKVKDT